MPNFTKDKIWGFVLIALGIASLWFQPFDRLNGKLKGEPEQVLTIVLVGLAIVILMIGAKGSAGLKALAVFWIVTP